MGLVLDGWRKVSVSIIATEQNEHCIYIIINHIKMMMWFQWEIQLLCSADYLGHRNVRWCIVRATLVSNIRGTYHVSTS